MGKEQSKLGLIGLTSIVIGGVIGGGIFNVSKILAEHASLGAIIISWAISGLGLLSIAMTFKILNSTRPDLSTGIYLYAHKGFGNYAGFNIAWGYWMGAAIGNVVLSVMLNDAFGLFFPVLLEHGWPTFIFASVFTWFFTLIVSFGLKIAATINTISTILKFLSLALIIILLFSFANFDLMHIDFWGKESHMAPISTQVNSTMLITLFYFMGIEGAVIVSSRAKDSEDVGRATIIGYLICLALNIMLCILPFGFVTQPEIIQLNDPAVAQILGKGIGDWARIFVNISVIIAVAGAWLVSTIIAAKLPADAARDHVLPHFFAHYNKQGAPINALLITACFIEAALLLILQARNIYVLSVEISGIMIIPTYILSAMFLVKISLKRQISEFPVTRQLTIIIGTVASLYCLWVIYAGNIHLLLLSSILYVIGIFFYWLTRRKESTPLFTLAERYVVGLLVAAMLFSLLLEWEKQTIG